MEEVSGRSSPTDLPVGRGRWFALPPLTRPTASVYRHERRQYAAVLRFKSDDSSAPPIEKQQAGAEAQTTKNVAEYAADPCAQRAGLRRYYTQSTHKTLTSLPTGFDDSRERSGL